jgi:hypothetical protein
MSARIELANLLFVEKIGKPYPVGGDEEVTSPSELFEHRSKDRIGAEPAIIGCDKDGIFLVFVAVAHEFDCLRLQSCADLCQAIH